MELVCAPLNDDISMTLINHNHRYVYVLRIPSSLERLNL